METVGAIVSGLLALFIMLVVYALASGATRFDQVPQARFQPNTPELNRKDLEDHIAAATRELVVLSGTLGDRVWDAEMAETIKARLLTMKRLNIRILSAEPLKGRGHPVWLLLDDPEVAATGRLEIREYRDATRYGHIRVRDAEFFTLEKAAGSGQQASSERVITVPPMQDLMGAAYLLSRFHEIWLRSHKIIRDGGTVSD